MQPGEPGDGLSLIGPAITDVAGEPAGRTQIQRLIERYHWSVSYCHDKVAVEIACGTGQGLGLIGRRARRVYGLDISSENLERARRTHGSRIALAQADAQVLPLADESVDAVILLEALYFLPRAREFLSEAHRVLRPGGVLLISVINKDCPDFNPRHPLYFERYGAPELARQLTVHGFSPQCFGIIPMDQPSLRSRIFKPLKQLAVRLDLIPKSMQARQLLKRIVFGRLETMPHDAAALPAPERPPTPIPSGTPDLIHQVILCAGHRLQGPDV